MELKSLKPVLTDIACRIKEVLREDYFSNKQVTPVP